MTGHQIAKKTNHKKTNKTKKEKMEPKNSYECTGRNKSAAQTKTDDKAEQKRKRLLNKLQ
tara:strand:- start:1666 stop:1845 length:180 start_codon:yes stop_codon:yes gene_type:complete